MTKQDWRNEADYAYTKDLDNKGWAWEFIRRRQDYRQEYEECRKFIEENYDGDWNAEVAFYSPQLGSMETAEDWEERRKSGTGSRILTDTQSRALYWGLFAMYDPHRSYDPTVVRFDLTNPFPAFYATFPEQIKTKGANVVGLQDFRELLKPKKLTLNEDIVYVAFDARRPLSNQISKTKKFLEQYQDKKSRLVSSGKPQKAGFPLYIRMLDAVDELGGTLTAGKIIQQIHPDKEFKGTGGYAYASYKQIPFKNGKRLWKTIISTVYYMEINARKPRKRKNYRNPKNSHSRRKEVK